MIPGIDLKLNGTVYVLPPLNLASVRRHREVLAKMQASLAPDIEIVGDLVFEPLRRNYPEIDKSIIEDGLDYGNVFDAFVGLMNLSELVKKTGEFSRSVQKAMMDAMGTNSNP